MLAATDRAFKMLLDEGADWEVENKVNGNFFLINLLTFHELVC